MVDDEVPYLVELLIGVMILSGCLLGVFLP